MQPSLSHPWDELRRKPQVDLIWSDLEIGLHGCTDGQTIQLDVRLGQVERRCALAHELDHIHHGHTCSQDEQKEAAVRERVARRLIPLSILGQSLAYSLDLDEVAFDVWVTREVLDDRLATLTENELLHLQGSTAHHRFAS